MLDSSLAKEFGRCSASTKHSSAIFMCKNKPRTSRAILFRCCRTACWELHRFRTVGRQTKRSAQVKNKEKPTRTHMDQHVPNNKQKPTRSHMDQHVPNNKVYIPNEIGRGVSSALRSPFHSIHPFIRPFLRSPFHPSIRPSMYSCIISMSSFLAEPYVNLLFSARPGVSGQVDQHGPDDGRG